VNARRLLAAATGLISAAVLSLGLAGCGADDPFVVEAEFTRAFNLFEGSRVRVLGVDVGVIETVRVSPDSDTVHVAMEIHDEDIELPEDVNAIIAFDSLLGERHVAFDPPYTGGPALESGAVIPLERTMAPSEFDEVLESWNEFLEGMPPDEVARLVTNAADVLDGRGDELGRTLEDVATAVEVLEENDDEIISLVSRLADLNETLGTRDTGIERIIVDWNTVLASLVEERDALDTALSGVGRMSEELGDLLATNRERLEEDVQTVTRVGRTAVRNLDEIDLTLLGQSELFRHAERVVSRERNWLPLINHADGIPAILADRLANRLARLCAEMGFTECAEVDFWEGELPGEMCIPGLVPCPPDGGSDGGDGGGVIPMAQALEDAVERVPELGEGLTRLQERREQEQEAVTTERDGTEVEERRTGVGRILDGWLPGMVGR
jgi:phospholipid/cholesterol/gamma-HCH transport system substrate-binding protein